MIDGAQVTACLVTRGDVDLGEILDSLPFERFVVYDNQPDLGVYGRYAAIARADTRYVFVQDDDCVLAPEAFEMLLAAYQPGHVSANLPQRFRDTGSYDDSCLVGFGAIFDRDLPLMAFGKFFGHGANGLMPSELMWRAITEQPGPFLRECDTVFTMLTPRILVDAPYTDLPWAHADNRLWKQPEHVGERERMRQLVRQVRDA